jgi:hypothetical protein
VFGFPKAVSTMKNCLRIFLTTMPGYSTYRVGAAFGDPLYALRAPSL